MQKDHPSCNLLSNADSSLPRDSVIRFVKQIEKSGSVTVLVDDVKIFFMLADANQGHQLRVMPYLH
jgi:hypothetical protein